MFSVKSPTVNILSFVINHAAKHSTLPLLRDSRHSCTSVVLSRSLAPPFFLPTSRMQLMPLESNVSGRTLEA